MLISTNYDILLNLIDEWNLLYYIMLCYILPISNNANLNVEQPDIGLIEYMLHLEFVRLRLY